MNTSARQIISVIVLLVVLTLIGWGVGEYAQKLPQPQGSIASPSTSDAITLQGQDGKTVLQLLERDHKVETTDSSIGKIITSIDGKQSTAEAFWIYYVDGEQGLSGVDEAQTKNGQKIEVRYEVYAESGE